MKKEIWCNHEIRFVEKEGEWWAVAKDVADALNYRNTKDSIKRHCKGVAKHDLLTAGGKQLVNIIPETDIYRMAFRSDKPEAEEFQDWVCQIIKQLRQSAGLEGFQIFRMLDKEHQKEAMSKLSQSLKKPVRVDFIKANTIANKAVSTKHGHSKMVKKADMSPEMLVDRQEILEDTVSLMTVNDRFGLNVSVSDQVYKLASGEVVRSA